MITEIINKLETAYAGVRQAAKEVADFLKEKISSEKAGYRIDYLLDIDEFPYVYEFENKGIEISFRIPLEWSETLIIEEFGVLVTDSQNGDFESYNLQIQHLDDQKLYDLLNAFMRKEFSRSELLEKMKVTFPDVEIDVAK